MNFHYSIKLMYMYMCQIISCLCNKNDWEKEDVRQQVEHNY